MIRRNARLRREYLYRKSLQGKELEAYEKKRRIQEALQEGRPVPTDLKAVAADVIGDAQFDDLNTAGGPAVSIDDEYAHAADSEPKVLITTARDPSSRLQQFSKELKLLIPNSQRINRGNSVVKELVASCRSSGVTDIVIVHEHRGEPDGMIVCHLPYGPTAYFGLTNCVLRHDIRDQDLGTVSEAYPHLIFDKFETKLGMRVKDILSHLYPPPKEESQRIITFANNNDFISFRHHTYERDMSKSTGPDGVELTEIGPRFEMRLYQIKLGTIDMLEAENEWVLRPYMNTAKKRKAL